MMVRREVGRRWCSKDEEVSRAGSCCKKPEVWVWWSEWIEWTGWLSLGFGSLLSLLLV
jgi:hypothetical protein